MFRNRIKIYAPAFLFAIAVFSSAPNSRAEEPKLAAPLEVGTIFWNNSPDRNPSANKAEEPPAARPLILNRAVTDSAAPSK